MSRAGKMEGQRKAFLWAVFVCIIVTSCQAPRQEDRVPAPGGDAYVSETEVLKFLDTLFVYGQEHEMFNMPPGDGTFLRLLVASSGAQRALEIGTSNGLSAIWIGLGLRETGGRLTTIEIDHEKAEEAKQNIHTAGMDNIIEVIEADAFKTVPKLEGTFDFIHLDAWKEDYKRFFDLFYPKVEQGGIIAAHNAVLMNNYMQDYLDVVNNHPELFSLIAQTSSDGFAVSYRKREPFGEQP